MNTQTEIKDILRHDNINSTREYLNDEEDIQEIIINGSELQIKEWEGKRVVTFKDIDLLHKKSEGTAKVRFNNHKKRFEEKVDYFVIKPSDILKYTTYTLGIKKIPNRGLTLLTESGYLLLVKTYDDNLAWKVQRDLVNSYFALREVVEAVQSNHNGLTLTPEQFTASSEALIACAAVFEKMFNFATINYGQQSDIQEWGRKRINELLDGAQSAKYKKLSRIYFKNMWIDFSKQFKCATYRDLNPIHIDSAKEFLLNWKYN